MPDERSDQFRNPHGECGERLLTEMNIGHRELTEWALGNIKDIGPRTILDIGCGGGMMVSLLGEKYPDSAIVGIDISESSIAFAENVNKALIEDGRCAFRKCSVDDIPFDDENIDLAISCESYFFWPDLVHAIEEISRVVSYEGTLVIISEQYPHPDFNAINDKHCREFGMKLVSNDYMKALLETFGFEVSVITVEEKNWVEFIGKKVNSSSSVFF